MLFLYPLVYIVTWSVPFMMHVLDLDTVERARAPLWLSVLATASVCSQGAIYCVLFMAQERPWRDVRGGFWAGLGARLRLDWGAPERTLGGRTREEMHDEEGFARSRRDGEVRQENADRDERQRVARESPLATPRQAKGGQNWWDAQVDGWGGSDEDEDGGGAGESGVVAGKEDEEPARTSMGVGGERLA